MLNALLKGNFVQVDVEGKKHFRNLSPSETIHWYNSTFNWMSLPEGYYISKATIDFSYETLHVR